MFRNLYIKLALAGLALYTLGWAIGRGTRPPPPVYQEKTEEEVQEKAWESMVAGVEIKSLTKDEKTNVRIITRWLRPDGSVSADQTIDSSKETKEEAESKKEVVEVVKEVEVIKWRTKETKITLPPPNWSASIIPKFSLSDIQERRFDPSLALVVTRRLGQLDLPIIGSVQVEAGGYADTQKSAGVVLTFRY